MVAACGCWVLYAGAGLWIMGDGLSFEVGRAHLCAVHVIHAWGVLLVAVVVPCHVHVVTVSKIRCGEAHRLLRCWFVCTCCFLANVLTSMDNQYFEANTTS